MTKVREISRVYPTESPCKNQKRKKRRRNALCDAMISESLKSELQRMSLALDHDVRNLESPEGDSSCHLTTIGFKDEILTGHILFLDHKKHYRNVNFDIHEFYKRTGDKYILPSLAMSIFHDIDAKTNMFNDLKIKVEKLQNYLIYISQKYDSKNCFHNSLHAADVGQTLYSMLYHNNTLINRFNNLELFTLLLSAFVHDVGHNGTSNDFLVKTADPLAIKYNDQSVLENYHISIAWKSLLINENNFIEDMEDSQKFRSLLIKLILATDNSKHFEKVGYLSNPKYSGTSEKKNGSGGIQYNDKNFVMEILIHAADISNPTKRFRTYGQWVDRIMDEFYALGDLEQRKGMPVSQLYRRDFSRAKVQHGFLQYFVQPLFTLINEHLDGVDVTAHLTNIDNNLHHWKALMASDEH